MKYHMLTLGPGYSVILPKNSYEPEITVFKSIGEKRRLGERFEVKYTETQFPHSFNHTILW